MEQFLFYAGDDDWLLNLKQEFLTQLVQLSITIDAKGFFQIDRRFLATVSFLFLFYGLNFV